MMAVWKIAPALVTGNTIVLKPASDTPLEPVATTQSWLGRALGYGVVTLNVGGADYRFRGVSAPLDLRDSLKTAMENARESADYQMKGIGNHLFENHVRVADRLPETGE